ncbi:MAG: polysaccharide deacetylase [Acidobacteriaceae bacterium]|nr:polysaccharide deacetylase [Acidobacteriaceae bacterium]
MPHRAAIAASLLTATAVAGSSAYAALWPQSQIFGEVLIAPKRPKEIALTYDDGPNDVATERLLEVLARYDVRATFFMIGRFVRQRPEIVRAVASAGHLIGNHTETHPWLPWQSATRIREELTACNAALADTLGAPVRLFRPPHGARRPYVLKVARELGLTTVQWNIIVQDWNPTTPEILLDRIQRGIGRNRKRGDASNIVLHDGGDTSLGQPRLPTVEATARLLELCKSTSTKFVTPEDWLKPT